MSERSEKLINDYDKSKAVTQSTETETLNFKVSPEFKRSFKGYAVSQGLTMLELLREGFELSKEKRDS